MPEYYNNDIKKKKMDKLNQMPFSLKKIIFLYSLPMIIITFDIFRSSIHSIKIIASGLIILLSTQFHIRKLFNSITFKFFYCVKRKLILFVILYVIMRTISLFETYIDNPREYKYEFKNPFDKNFKSQLFNNKNRVTNEIVQQRLKNESNNNSLLKRLFFRYRENQFSKNKSTSTISDSVHIGNLFQNLKNILSNELNGFTYLFTKNRNSGIENKINLVKNTNFKGTKEYKNNFIKDDSMFEKTNYIKELERENNFQDNSILNIPLTFILHYHTFILYMLYALILRTTYLLVTQSTVIYRNDLFSFLYGLEMIGLIFVMILYSSPYINCTITEKLLICSLIIVLVFLIRINLLPLEEESNSLFLKKMYDSLSKIYKDNYTVISQEYKEIVEIYYSNNEKKEKIQYNKYSILRLWLLHVPMIFIYNPMRILIALIPLIQQIINIKTIYWAIPIFIFSFCCQIWLGLLSGILINFTENYSKNQQINSDKDIIISLAIRMIFHGILYGIFIDQWIENSLLN